MPTTANYSWPTPADTDLVKNGADAMRDLGDAIDTTVKSVSDGRGLVHINTTDIGAAVSAVSVNDVFSASYDVYKVYIDLDATSVAAGDLTLRMRVGGSDNSSSNYIYGGIYRNTTNTTVVGSNSTGATSFYLGVQSDEGMGIVLDIFNPFQSNFRTKINSQSFGNDFANWFGGALSVDTSYTGFTLLTLSGTISTGKIRVFGVKQ